jgi:2-polyprenyl-6-methoxyphenol hydroxylase-like FAD-dependent oxidoreductase
MRSLTASEAQTQVVVIGGGPSGLFAAAELARHGVPARILEREPVPHRQARATALQPGTLEILARAGVIDRVLASSVHLGCARLFDGGLQPVSELAFAGVGCPWEFQCSLPQWRTEQLLAERLGELGGVVERMSIVLLSLASAHHQGRSSTVMCRCPIRGDACRAPAPNTGRMRTFSTRY